MSSLTMFHRENTSSIERFQTVGFETTLFRISVSILAMKILEKETAVL